MTVICLRATTASGSPELRGSAVCPTTDIQSPPTANPVHDPIHVNISKGECEAKFNVENVELIENFGFKKNELKMIESILEENKDIIIARWNEYFKK